MKAYNLIHAHTRTHTQKHYILVSLQIGKVRVLTLNAKPQTYRIYDCIYRDGEIVVYSAGLIVCPHLKFWVSKCTVVVHDLMGAQR